MSHADRIYLIIYVLRCCGAVISLDKFCWMLRDAKAQRESRDPGVSSSVGSERQYEAHAAFCLRLPVPVG